MNLPKDIRDRVKRARAGYKAALEEWVSAERELLACVMERFPVGEGVEGPGVYAERGTSLVEAGREVLLEDDVPTRPDLRKA